MKKAVLLATILARSLPILIAASMLDAGSLSYAFAGGEVDYENFSNSLIYKNSVHNGPATGLITGDHAYYFALLSGLTNATTIDATLDNGTPLANGGWVYEDLATNTPTPGLLNGNYTTDPGVDVSQTPGDPANFVVVGWSANIGTTYAEAKAWWNSGNPNSGPNGWFAISDIASNVVVGGNPYPVPTIFGPTPGYEIQGFTLNLYTIGPLVVDASWASTVSATGATLNGTVTPDGLADTAWFEWGTTTAYGNTTAVTNFSTPSSAVPLNATLTGLTPGTVYHYHLAGASSVSTNYSRDISFCTCIRTWTVTNLVGNGSGTFPYLLSVAAPNDVINFAPGLTGTLTTAISLDRNLTIIGPGANSLTFSGSNTYLGVAGGVTGSISGVTISGGSGVLNSGDLTIYNCIVTGNTNQGWQAFGGGASNGGRLYLVGCTFSGNSAIGSIGSPGINATGTFSPAYNGYPGGSAEGGAIYNTGNLTALNCTFAGNTAQGGAGGNGGSGGTYSPGGRGGNGGSGIGGAIETFGNCTLINCTFANNTTTLGNGGIGGSQVGPPSQAPNGTNGVALGGGIHISPGGSVAIGNTIVAGNTGTSPDTSGAFTSSGYNLVGKTDGSSGWVASDLTGTIATPLSLGLGPLADNGGPTPTMALRVGSPAIDKGKSFGLTTDQRGQPRPYVFPGASPAAGGDSADIGAYEASELRITAAQKTGNHLRLDFINWLGTNYEVQSRSDLLTGSWGSLAGSTPGNGGIASTTVSNAFNQSQQFYRIHPVP